MTFDTLIRDTDKRTIVDKSFNAYKAFPDFESRPKAIIVERAQTHGRKRLVVSMNINGCGHRVRKVVRLNDAVKETLGQYPDVILIQEAR